MAFEVRISRATAGDRTDDVYELTDAGETVRAEVWPHWGFNCLRWQVRQPDGHWADIFYAAPDWEANPIPTRSGHPILFPFPGRLRGGNFRFDGKSYQLPLNDSTKQNAIHGFTPWNRWRAIEWNAEEDFAFVTGQFNLKKDLPDHVDDWPADFNLNVTYRLYRDRLRVDAKVETIGRGPLPFGLGYHPYLRLPGVHDSDIGGHILWANVNQLWEAKESLPTGRTIPIPRELNFQVPRAIGATQFDHIFTDIQIPATGLESLIEIATLSHPQSAMQMTLRADPAFRELVLFTPTHRQAIAIEPYTCSADAANLATRGIDSGWRQLAMSEEWESSVEYTWEPRTV